MLCHKGVMTPLSTINRHVLASITQYFLLHSSLMVYLSWQHIISLLEYDLGFARVAPGLRQTKLTPEHVFLSPRSRMNVSLVAEVGFICDLNCIMNSLL